MKKLTNEEINFVNGGNIIGAIYGVLSHPTTISLGITGTGFGYGISGGNPIVAAGLEFIGMYYGKKKLEEHNLYEKKMNTIKIKALREAYGEEYNKSINRKTTLLLEELTDDIAIVLNAVKSSNIDELTMLKCRKKYIVSVIKQIMDLGVLSVSEVYAIAEKCKTKLSYSGGVKSLSLSRDIKDEKSLEVIEAKIIGVNKKDFIENVFSDVINSNTVKRRLTGQDNSRYLNKIEIYGGVLAGSIITFSGYLFEKMNSMVESEKMECVWDSTNTTLMCEGII